MNMKIRSVWTWAALLPVLPLSADVVPSLTKPTLAASGSGYVVTYGLSGEPAAVTAAFEAQDAAGAWHPLVGAPTWQLEGDVNALVETGADRSFRWTPGSLVATNAALRVSLTAWPTNGLPAYLVMDLAKTSAQRIRYYATTNDLPGGLLENHAYRTSRVVLRKIPAMGNAYTLGNSGSTWSATLGYDYYIGVFPVTQAQLMAVYGSTLSEFWLQGDRWMRPVDSAVIARIRMNGTTNYDYDYPADPAASSILGLLRTRSGGQVAFDLPGEAEWEIAARAGHANGYWGNGSPQSGSDTDDNLPGRYVNNGGKVSISDYTKSGLAAQYPASAGTAIAGTYAPNDWGLYDCDGNVCEWVLDYDSTLATRQASNGTIILKTDEAKAPAGWYRRIRKGGAFDSGAKSCYAGCRTNNMPANDETYTKYRCGFRLADRCGFGQTSRATYASAVSDALAPVSVEVAGASSATALDSRDKTSLAKVAQRPLFERRGFRLILR